MVINYTSMVPRLLHRRSVFIFDEVASPHARVSGDAYDREQIFVISNLKP